MKNFGYFIGIALGAVFLLSLLLFLFYIHFKNKIYQNIINKYKNNVSDEVNSDINLWAKHTKNYFLSKNLFLEKKENKYFEIDGIIFSKKAIIIVNTKKIKGSISGDYNETKWVKKYENKNTTINNLIRQTEPKLNFIRNIIGYDVPVIMIFVFSNWLENFDIKNIPSHILLTRQIEIFNTLDKINQSLKDILTQRQIKSYYKKINSIKLNLVEKQIYYDYKKSN